MTPKDLKDILKVMKKMGVLYLKTADIELSLSQDALNIRPSKIKAIQSDPLVEQTKGHMGYSDDDVLFWPNVSSQEAG